MIDESTEIGTHRRDKSGIRGAANDKYMYLEDVQPGFNDNTDVIEKVFNKLQLKLSIFIVIFIILGSLVIAFISGYDRYVYSDNGAYMHIVKKRFHLLPTTDYVYLKITPVTNKCK